MDKEKLLQPEILATDKILSIFSPRKKNYHTNLIINTRNDYGLLERRMLYCIINQLDPNMNIQETDLFSNIYFRIPVSTFGKDYSYKHIKQAINSITTRSMTGGNDKTNYAWSITPIPFAEVKNGIVKLLLVSEAVPYFLDLRRKGYTSYELEMALKLRSEYSQRMYEHLCQYRNTKFWSLSIEKFRWLMAIDDKGYNHANMCRQIIECSLAEIAEKTDITATYECFKTGRKFTDIRFDINKEESEARAEDQQEYEDFMKHLQSLPMGKQQVYLTTAFTNYKFTRSQMDEILTSEELMGKFLEVHWRIQMGKVDIQTDASRYMAGILLKMGWNRKG